MSFTPWPVQAFDEIDSTNAEARRRGEAGEAGPLWITASSQTEGRGRRGRVWSSRPDNLTATLLTTTFRPPAEAALVSFVVALAVSDVFRYWAPPEIVTLKWPNDVLIAGDKASGLLIESGPRPGGGLWLAIGAGLNLTWAPKDAERPATSLADHLAGDRKRAPTPVEALTALDQALQTRLRQWDASGSASILDDWRVRAPGIPGPCTARLGHETVTGTAEGLSGDGSLRLRTDAGDLRLISAGDVFFGASA